MQTFYLDRFILAQDKQSGFDSGKNQYESALYEMTKGRKLTHWIWYIFPQEKHLGYSANSKYYGLDGVEEAKAYLEHPVLSQRLIEITKAVLAHKGHLSLREIMGGSTDEMKFRSSMKIFDQACPNSIFEEALKAFPKGKKE